MVAQLKSPKAAVFGEALFDLIELSEIVLHSYIGGSPFNVAQSFARQNVDVSYLSPISTDTYGTRLTEFAIKEGIRLPQHNRSDLPTSLALVYKDKLGQPDYRLYRKHIADLDIDADTLQSIIPTDIELFHTGSLALVPDMVDVLVPCFQVLQQRGVCISIDINMRKGVEHDSKSYSKAVKSLISYANILKVSDEDLLLLGSRLSPLEGAKQLLVESGASMVLLTQGELGASLITNDFLLTKPVFSPKPFVDAVGAGDTFFSAFLAQLLRKGEINQPWSEESLEKTLKFALMAATLNVETNGCNPPSQAEVELALDSRTKGG
jgi:fructokinase